MNTQILLVDDHAMFSAGLRGLLQSRFPEAVIREAGSGHAALERADETTPDLVIMDLHLPDQNGIEISRQILERHPAAKIIILSGEPNLSYVNQALQVGASAYLLKTSTPELLPAAVEAVLAGKLYLCPEANAFVLQDYRRVLADAGATPKPALSDREREVLRSIANGLRTKDIAARLDLSVKTVDTYRRRLMKKLACSGTADLVRHALREGIIQQ